MKKNNITNIDKIVNLILIILLDWLKVILNMNKRSYMICHIITLQWFGTTKSCAFGKTIKRCLIDSTAWVWLS